MPYRTIAAFSGRLRNDDLDQVVVVGARMSDDADNSPVVGEEGRDRVLDLFELEADAFPEGIRFALQVVHVIDRQDRLAGREPIGARLHGAMRWRALRRYVTDRREARTESGHREMRRTPVPRVAPPSAVPAATSPCKLATEGRKISVSAISTNTAVSSSSFAGSPRRAQKRVIARRGAPAAELFAAVSLPCCPLLLRIARCTQLRISSRENH